VCISGVDPLNLCGTLLPGDKVPALSGNRILFRDGLPVATIIAGKIGYLLEPGAERELLHAHLVGRH
jgi:ATP-dependent Lhr-like helicase